MGDAMNGGGKSREETQEIVNSREVKRLGEDARKKRKEGRWKKLKTVSTGAAFVFGAAVAGTLGYEAGHDKGVEETELPEPLSDENLFINPVDMDEGVLYDSDLNSYQIPFNKTTTSTLIEGHESMQKWFNYLQTNGGVDWERSFVKSDKFGNVHIKLVENDSDNEKNDVISYGEILEKLPEIEGVDEINFEPIGYRGTNATVERYVSDPEMIEKAKKVAEVEGDYSAMKLIDRFTSEGITNPSIQFIDEDGGVSVPLDNGSFEYILSFVEDGNEEDRDFKDLRDTWTQSMQAYFKALTESKYNPHGLLQMHPEDLDDAFEWLENQGYWIETYNKGQVQQLIDKTDITALGSLLEDWQYNSEVILADTPDGLTGYSGVAFRKDGDIMYPVKLPLYQDDIESIKG